MQRRPTSAFRAGRRDDLPRKHLLSYGLIVGLFILLLGSSLFASWAAVDVVNSTRAYATGEGRYSKAQKIAVLSLHRYAYSHEQMDYDAFIAAIAIPRGDRSARLALQHDPMQTRAAAAGLLKGDNHPADIAGMIRLYRMFSWWQPFAAAVADWKEGDALVAKLIDQGRSLHAAVAAGRLDDKTRAAILARIDRIDGRLTVLENTFSTHMGEAARGATVLVVLGLGLATILLWAVGILFAMRLIREQLVLDRLLRSSERRFRDYAEVASDWYWEMDADYRITFMSQQFFDLTGLSPEVALGHSGRDFIQANADTDEHRKRCLIALEERKPFREVHLRCGRADGRPGFFSISGKPHTNVIGRFAGFRGVGTDITAAMRDEQVLREAKVRAESANRAKSEFLANMSHELRTPLNAILGFSEIIETRLFGSEVLDRYADYARDIRVSGKHLLSIIDDVLDLSKIEAGHALLEETEVGIDALATDVVTLFAERAKQAGIELVIQLPSPLFSVRIDRRKMVQVLANLVSNALKFTPAGGRVTLSASREAVDTIIVSVRDTGIGIAAEDMENVLAPFGQVESVFSRRHHGTGLGLPLSKSLTELHGGTLSLSSARNTGTVVTVRLPAERVVDDPLAATRARATE